MIEHLRKKRLIKIQMAGQILGDLSYIWNLKKKKNLSPICIYKTELTDTENRLMVAEVEGGENG